jgi:guanyl-specific ribonuclease Sa
MRITQCGDAHLIALSAKEASTLLDAAVLIAVAVDSVPDVALPAEMATLVGDIFSGLSKAVSKEESVSSECLG